MANRIAFVFGSNGPAAMAPLEFARSDSERFANILASETCGFEVRAPIDRTDVFRVKKDFAAAIENCGPADTFVCYFAGHGVLNRGTLLLLWDDTDPKRLLSTAIAVSEITYGLAQCEANSKLLILDCCHAGGAVPTLGLRNALGAPAEELVVPPENFLVLMASGRLERARELRDLGGGFLTSALLRALNPLDGWELRDQSRQVTIDRLRAWLEQQAARHNIDHPTLQVPIPKLFGAQRGEVSLTIPVPPWVPFVMSCRDGSQLVILPINPGEGKYAWAIGKWPVTNEQYRRFCEEACYPEPCGQHFQKEGHEVRGGWFGPFYPWREAEFSSEDKPVVCVSREDVILYCAWATRLVWSDGIIVKPVPTWLWDFAAVEMRGGNLVQSNNLSLHHNAAAPAAITSEPSRLNPLGVSDLIGNVWEWCGFAESPSPILPSLVYRGHHLMGGSELRGGGFLDDVGKVRLRLFVTELHQGEETRHSDLGFRVAAKIPLDLLPPKVVARLKLSDVAEPHDGLEDPRRRPRQRAARRIGGDG